MRFTISILFLFAFTSSHAATKTWSGATNNNWNTGSNWGGTAPAAGDIANIPGGLTNYPVINNTVTITTVNINNTGSGASITVTTGGSFTVSGLLTVNANGTFSVNGGTATLAGITAAGSVSVSGGTITSTVNITLNSGATLTQSGGLIHLAVNTSTNPTDNIVIASGATVTQSGGTLHIKDYRASAGTFNQTGSSAVFKVFHDWKPGTGSVFNSTAGTVEFAGSGGGGPDFSTGTRQFTNIIVDSGIDPGFDNTAASTISVAGDYTNNNSVLALTAGATFTFNGSGSQTITTASASATFGNVVINKSSGTLSLASNITVAGDWTNNGGTFSGGAYTVTFSGTANTIGGSASTSFAGLALADLAVITMSNNNSCTSLTLPAGANSTSLTHSGTASLTVNGNVTVNQPTASKIIAWNINGGSAIVSGNVSVGGSNTSTARIAKIVLTSGTLTIAGDLLYNSASSTPMTAVVDMSGGSGTMNIAGNMTLTNTSGTLTPGTSSTVVYNGTGAQTIIDGSSISYNHLTINKASGTASLGTATSIDGDMTISAGTLSTGAENYGLTVGGNWTNNGGTFSGGTSTVTLSGASQTIGGSNSTTFPNLTIAAGANYVMNTDNPCSSLTFAASSTASSLTHGSTTTLTINGAVTINQPIASVTTAWNINGGTATVSGVISFAGTNTTAARVGKITITTGTLNANGGITFAASASATKVIDMSGGAGTLNLKGALTVPANSSTLTAGTSGSIFNYADVAAQTVNFFSAGAYHNLHINNTHGSGATLSAAITTANVTGNLGVQTGLFSNDGFAIAGNAGKTFEVTNGATVALSGTSTMPSGFGTKTFGATSTVNYAGTTQTATGETYGNLTISGSATKTLSGTATVNGTLTLTAGTLSIGANTLTLNGAVSTSSGTLTGGTTSNMTIGGSGASTTLPAVTLNNFTMNRTNGITLGGNVTVGGTFTLTDGKVTTSTNTLYINSTGSVTRTSGHVVGNFKKYITTGATNKTFEVGGPTNYTPIVVAFASVTTGGDLTAGATSGDHANIGSSSIDASKSANRTWTLTNSGILFTTYSATFTFVSGDLDAGANTNSFIVGRYAASAWSYPTVGTKTSTSTQATGLAAFGDFQLGQTSGKTWDGGALTNNWGDAANWNPDGVPSPTDNIDLLGANTININVAATADNLTLNNASLMLTVQTGFSLTLSGNLIFTTGTLNTQASFPAVGSTVSLNGGTVGYTAASGSQTVAAQGYVNLTVSGGGTKTLAATITPSGDITISGGTFDLSNYTCDRSSAGGTLTVSNGATLKIGGTNSLPSNYSAHSIGATSTIEYSGSNQSIAVPNSSQSYGHLTLSGSGTKTAAGALTIAGSFTINSGPTFAAGSYTHTMQGAFSNGGTFTAGTSTVQFTGGSDVTLTGATTFNNLTVNKSASTNTITLGNNISVATLTMTQGKILTDSNVLTVTSDRTGNGLIIGTLTRTHTFNASTAYAFEGPYNTLTFASGGTLPTSVTVTTTLSNPGANGSMEPIDRYYAISQTGGSGFSYTLRLHYEDSEVSSPNSETSPPLKIWRRTSTGPDLWTREGATSNNTTNNWVEQTGVTNVGTFSLSSRTVADIVPTLSQNATNPSPGQQVTYTLSYSNGGDGASTNTVVTAAAPTNTSYVSGTTAVNGVTKTDAADADEVTVSGSTITINLGTVAVGGSGTITYRIVVN